MDKSDWDWIDEWEEKFNNSISKDKCFVMMKDSIVDCTYCYDLLDRPLWQIYGHALVVGSIILVSLVGDLLFFTLFVKHKRLRYRSSIIGIAVLLVNAVLTTTYHFPILATTLSRKWRFSFTGCQILGFLSQDFFLTYWLIMGLLAFDKFCMAHFSGYPKRSKCILISLIIAAWVVPIVLSTITVDEYSVVVFRENIPMCVPFFPYDSKGRALNYIIGIAAAFIGGAIPFFLYIMVVCRAVSSCHRKRTAAENDSREETSRTGEPPRSSEFRQTWSTFLVIFLVSCVTQLPSSVILMVRWISQNAWCGIPHEIQFIAAELLCSTTAIVPFILIFDKPFRRRLKLLVLCCFRHRRNSNLNERCRSNSTGAEPRELGEFNIPSLISSESARHASSSYYRNRSSSFPIISQSKNFSSASFFNNDSALDKGIAGQNRFDDHSSPSTPSSYGVEEVTITKNTLMLT